MEAPMNRQSLRIFKRSLLGLLVFQHICFLLSFFIQDGKMDSAGAGWACFFVLLFVLWCGFKMWTVYGEHYFTGTVLMLVTTSIAMNEIRSLVGEFISPTFTDRRTLRLVVLVIVSLLDLIVIFAMAAFFVCLEMIRKQEKTQANGRVVYDVRPGTVQLNV